MLSLVSSVGLIYCSRCQRPGRVAKSVGHLTRKSEVLGSIPGLATTDSRRAVVSYWRKYVHEILVNRLGGLSLPRKSVVRLTDRPDMTLDAYRGRKQQQHNNNNNDVKATPYIKKKLKKMLSVFSYTISLILSGWMLSLLCSMGVTGMGELIYCCDVKTSLVTTYIGKLLVACLPLMMSLMVTNFILFFL